MAEFDLFKEVDAAWHRLTQYPGPDYDKPSFRMGFEACAELLGKLGWHPASELPKEKDVEVVMLVDVSSPQFTGAPLIRVPIFGRYINGWPEDVNVKWWCYPPKEE